MSSGTSPVQHRPHVSSPFLYQLSAGERELDIVMLDHGYARPWSTHPDASHAKPAKWLFVPRTLRLRNDRTIIESDTNVDVVKLVAPNPTAYDVVKARSVMNECDRHVNFARAGMQQPITDENWEEKLNRTGWTSGQNKLFNKIIKILSGDRLARLAYEGTPNEPVMRRIHLDKCAKRFRQTMSAIVWDTKTTTWLHSVLVNNLSLTLLTIYLDVLQTLKCKVPSLIDKMIHFSSTLHRGSGTTVEALNLLLKRPWDPAISTLNQHKPKKLPNAPLLLLTPSSAQHQSHSQSRRMKFWQSQLSNMGKVVPITMHVSSGGSGVTLSQCLEHMIGAVKSKVLELKSQYPNRPIILIGWNIGALVACQVALTDSLSGVVCLGFPSMGISGIRGSVEDPLLDSKVPTLFVIGQDSSVANQDDIEDLRERMKAETGLVVIGGADEYLRMNRTKKKLEGLTQSMVDRCIQDEMFEFLHAVLTSNPCPTTTVKSPAVSESNKKKDKKKKVQRDLLGELRGKQSSTPSSSRHTIHPSALGDSFGRLPGTPKSVKLPKEKIPILTQQEIFAAQYAQFLASTRKKKEDGKAKASIKRKSKSSESSSSKAKQAKVTEPSHKEPTAPPKPHSVNISTLGITQSVTLTTGTSTKKLGHLQPMGALNTQNTHSSILQGLSYNLQNRGLASPTETGVLEGILASSSPLSPLQPPLTPSKTSQGIAPSPALPPFTTGASGLLLAAASTSTTAGSILMTKMPNAVTSAIKTEPPQSVMQLKSAKVSSEVALQALIAAQAQPTAILSPVRGANGTQTSKVTHDNYDAHIQAIQKLQFHDFPLTTASLPANKGTLSFTQAKILSNIQPQESFTMSCAESTSSTTTSMAPSITTNSTTLTSALPSYSIPLTSSAMKQLDANSVVATAPTAAPLLTSTERAVTKSEATALRIALASQPTNISSLADQLLSTNSSTLNLDSHTMSLLTQLPSLMADDVEETPEQEEAKLPEASDDNTSSKVKSPTESSDSSSQDSSSLPSVSLFTATRTRRVRAPKSFSDYTE
ncbi:KAT8 regulatory NSL complex subunit 3-like [Anneissia japonica]|uniref:KAT8 regulatory NSL complex subunit 3-like n=1 Tax=Anneissia japonica TaxID=1529436 RepID=UPI001425B4C2|nr:KAT8 regulatory NSL complex subunit 3-like [Anneissia japonica]